MVFDEIAEKNKLGELNSTTNLDLYFEELAKFIEKNKNEDYLKLKNNADKQTLNKLILDSAKYDDLIMSDFIEITNKMEDIIKLGENFYEQYLLDVWNILTRGKKSFNKLILMMMIIVSSIEKKEDSILGSYLKIKETELRYYSDINKINLSSNIDPITTYLSNQNNFEEVIKKLSDSGIVSIFKHWYKVCDYNKLKLIVNDPSEISNNDITFSKHFNSYPKSSFDSKLNIYSISQNIINSLIDKGFTEDEILNSIFRTSVVSNIYKNKNDTIIIKNKKNFERLSTIINFNNDDFIFNKKFMEAVDNTLYKYKIYNIIALEGNIIKFIDFCDTNGFTHDLQIVIEKTIKTRVMNYDEIAHINLLCMKNKFYVKTIINEFCISYRSCKLSDTDKYEILEIMPWN